MVLAILAHEICHKYLQINNLKLFPDIENEILTDAATVYTGLGKLSLNGCEKTTSSSSTSGNVTITTQKVGYLNRLQFAFIYRLVCEMRNIPKKEMMQGLSSEAANLVNSESRNSSSYFNKKFFSDKIISQIISEEISLSQKEIATLNRRIRESQEIILPTAIELSEDFHVYTKSKIGPLMQMATKQVNKESHSYIKNLLALEEFKFYKSKMIEKEKELKEFAISLQKFLVDINRNYSKYLSKKSYEFLFQFKCPSCNKDLIIREKTLARVKCQKCNYSFIVDTGIDEVKNGFWERAKSLFKK
ncbi:MAG: hypothetical protein GX879_06530 [Bacteroidales bacterium]|nr:hypothetical protein [Bacteroidales bacterium]